MMIWNQGILRTAKLFRMIKRILISHCPVTYVRWVDIEWILNFLQRKMERISLCPAIQKISYTKIRVDFSSAVYFWGMRLHEICRTSIWYFCTKEGNPAPFEKDNKHFLFVVMQNTYSIHLIMSHHLELIKI